MDNKVLHIIIDMQNDFIKGSLANQDADKIVDPMVKYLEKLNVIDRMDEEIICTMDTHDWNYLSSNEGKHLPIEHCIKNTPGWCIDDRLLNVLKKHRRSHLTFLEKPTFGTLEWSSIDLITKHKYDEIEIMGTCTDICVISNALILKAVCPETKISVIENLCAGLAPEKHDAAIEVMRSCQIEIKEV